MTGAKRFQDFVTWQLMYDLSVRIWRATDEPAIARDEKFRNQIRDASDSIHRNIAEGFGRYNPGEFARFLDIARASAAETRALLKKGHAVGHFTDESFNELDRIAIRGFVAMARLQRYLRSEEAKRNASRIRYAGPG
jgi:four helix bundle protein